MTVQKKQRVVIVGGGFGGVRAALDLAKSGADVDVTIIDPKSYIEYYAAFYRVVTGGSPREVCIPYATLFRGTAIRHMRDSAASIDLQGKRVTGTSGSQYGYDFLIIAIGSETAYFGIPGMEELAYGMKTAQESAELKRHLHEVFEQARTCREQQDRTAAAHIVVIGAGPSGVELAGELAVYARTLARKHGISSALVTIDLVEAMSRVLPTLEPEMSRRALQRLRALGVNVLLGRSVTKEDAERVYLQDMQMKTKTVVWTAGVKAHRMLGGIAGLAVDKRGRAEVDAHRQAVGHSGVFVIGDAAATKYSGTAQTAVRDGSYVADTIVRTVRGATLVPCKDEPSAFAVPVGPGWAAVAYGPLRVYGRLGWWMRRAADLKVFVSMLSLRDALSLWFSGNTTIEVCPLCNADDCGC
jgi:NADH dehydrogenase